MASQRSIDLSAAYFVPDELTLKALVDAMRRGVRLRIITPGPHTDAEVVKTASRASWGTLLAEGAQIYEYQPTMFHCKAFIVDELLVSVGSTNFDTRSFRLNDEANLNVLDRGFAPRTERMRIESAAESLGADKSHAMDLAGVAVQQHHAGVPQDRDDLGDLLGLHVVIAEHGHGRDPSVQPQLPAQVTGLVRQAVIGQVAARHQHIRFVVDTLEQGRKTSWPLAAIVQVSYGGNAHGVHLTRPFAHRFAFPHFRGTPLALSTAWSATRFIGRYSRRWTPAASPS